MAVYTPLSDADIDGLLAQYDLGRRRRFDGIVAGVENSNFHLYTDDGRFVLTVFERRVKAGDLPYFLGLVDHLAQHGVAAPGPVARRDGTFLSRVADKPCVISTFLSGAARMTPSPAECRAAGAMLARLHQAGADFAMWRDNDLGLEGWRRLAALCAERADECAPRLSALIADEIAYLQTRWPRDLPSGPAHLDLFPDNVFFTEDRVSGVIDFYFAANDAYAYDLAIAALAFASDRGRLDIARLDATCAGYREARPLSADEDAAFNVLLQGAATRFLLTRLYDWLHQVPGAMVAVKDPLEYRDLLLALRGEISGTSS